jgi:hypothetical protein
MLKDIKRCENKINQERKQHFDNRKELGDTNVLFALRAFGSEIHYKHIHPSPSLSFPSSFISLSSILFPFRLHSVFLPLHSLPLSHFSTSIPHVLNCMSLLIAHSAPCFLSFYPILVRLSSFPHLNLAIIFLSPQVIRNFLCHTPLILPLFFFACPCLCPFHSALHSSIFLLLLIFPLLHWHIRSCGSTFLSFFSLFFLFSPAFRQYPALLGDSKMCEKK